jgi:hypothetical protein
MKNNYFSQNTWLQAGNEDRSPECKSNMSRAQVTEHDFQFVKIITHFVMLTYICTYITKPQNYLSVCLQGEESSLRSCHSASQEIPSLYGTGKVHYCVHKVMPLVPIPRQIYPVHTFPPYFPKVHYNIILPSMPRSSKSFFLSGFPTRVQGCIQKFLD